MLTENNLMYFYLQLTDLVQISNWAKNLQIQIIVYNNSIAIIEFKCVPIVDFIFSQNLLEREIRVQQTPMASIKNPLQIDVFQPAPCRLDQVMMRAYKSLEISGVEMLLLLLHPKTPNHSSLAY